VDIAGRGEHEGAAFYVYGVCLEEAELGLGMKLRKEERKLGGIWNFFKALLRTEQQQQLFHLWSSWQPRSSEQAGRSTTRLMLKSLHVWRKGTRHGSTIVRSHHPSERM